MINSHSRAVTAMLVVVLFMSTGGMMLKLSSWPALPLNGARSLVAALVFLIYLRKPKFTWSRAQILSAVSYALMLITYVQAVKWTTAANAIFLQYTSPIWVALFSIWLLKERPSRLDWIATGAVLVGMLLFFSDQLTPSGFWGNVIAIFSGMCMAFFLIFLRMQNDGSATETVFLGNVIAGVIGLPFIIFGDLPVNPRELGIIVYLGVIQLGIPYLVVSLAIVYMSALQTVLIKNLNPVLTPIWVYFVIGEQPGPRAVLGGLIVASAVVLRTVYAGKSSSRARPSPKEPVINP